MFFYVGVILDGASYNILALVLVMAGILELMNRNKITTKSIIKQGILMFLIFFTKQNIGVFYTISVFVYELLINKEKIVKVLKMLLVAIVLSVISFFIMHLCGILDGFINYAVLGIKEFSANYFIEKKGMLVALLLIYVLVIYGVIYFHATKKMYAKKVKLLLVFATTNIFTLYPFMNEYHIKYAFFITLIMAVFYLDRMIDKTLFSSKAMDKIILIMMSIGFFVTTQQVRMENYDKIIVGEEYKIIQNFGIDEDEYRLLKRYEQYKNSTKNKTICISKYSNLYSVVFKDFNGIFDIPNIGNFGKDGVNGVIEKIEEMHNIEFILYYDYNSQESSEIRAFIQKNNEAIYRDADMSVFYKK